MTADEIHGPICQEISQVDSLRIIDRRLSLEIEMQAHADDRLIEAALCRVKAAARSEMPFAKHAGDIARLPERLRQDHLVEREIVYVIDRSQGPARPVESIDSTD